MGLGKPGDKATLEVWRAGKKITLAATLGEAKEQADTDAAGGKQPQGKLGIAVRPLTPDKRQQAGVSSGVVVEQVGGAAAQAGIESGDVILAVNGTPVKSVQQLQALVSKENKHLALLIQRGDAKIFIPVALG